mmetsp:Transcript_29589/g.73925  ORF Transcript_29589/g.73925 Transcript_29589/m.73925 type:complete len:98 (-) Transcript_29589:286-579(-)
MFPLAHLPAAAAAGAAAGPDVYPAPVAELATAMYLVAPLKSPHPLELLEPPKPPMLLVQEVRSTGESQEGLPTAIYGAATRHRRCRFRTRAAQRCRR